MPVEQRKEEQTVAVNTSNKLAMVSALSLYLSFRAPCNFLKTGYVVKTRYENPYVSLLVLKVVFPDHHRQHLELVRNESSWPRLGPMESDTLGVGTSCSWVNETPRGILMFHQA